MSAHVSSFLSGTNGIVATPDVIHQAQFALDVKAAVLPLYEKIFNVEYPLPKLDTLVVGISRLISFFFFE